MSSAEQGSFTIIREDRAEDPKSVVSDGLRIGRLPDSDVWLNHPGVSRLHAGINEVEGYFYLVNLSGSSATTLNGRVVPFNEAEALTTGDSLQIGPYFLYIDEIEPDKLRLVIRVTQKFAVNVGERESRHTGPIDKRVSGRLRTSGSLEVANSLKVFWGKRSREKADRPSPLHPRTPPRPGKARFNWRPTRDLVRPWPFAVLVWGLIVVGGFSAIAAFTHKSIFAPGKVSEPHTKTTLELMPSIANESNGNSCTSCHAFGMSAANMEKMNANCAACHNTTAFFPSVTRAHREAGITCTTCHGEHRGESFRPLVGSLESCVQCHRDENKKLYNGKSVHTPHGGTYGYPVINGVWVWKGLPEEELGEKPELAQFLKQNRVTPNQTRAWRNAQFHGIHTQRVRIIPGVAVDGIQDGNFKRLSCSSCHKSGFGSSIDRNFPRSTCPLCHTARVFNDVSRRGTGADTPSCTSCHVQHLKDPHWASSLRLAQSNAPDVPLSDIK